MTDAHEDTHRLAVQLAIKVLNYNNNKPRKATQTDTLHESDGKTGATVIVKVTKTLVRSVRDGLKEAEQEDHATH